MFLDRRNKNKVVIVRESPQDTVIVKDLKTGKKYLVEKKNLIEILVKQLEACDNGSQAPC